MCPRWAFRSRGRSGEGGGEAVGHPAAELPAGLLERAHPTRHREPTAQTALGALGLLVSGVPYVAVLAALMFICCIVQIGPTLVLLGGIGWLWYTGDHGWAIALGVWSAFVGTLDNFIRPALIKRGADLPFLLILAGVLGGLLTFGIVGLFIGPVVLAITYRLLEAWIAEGEPPKRGA